MNIPNGYPPPTPMELPFPAPSFLENNPYFGAGFGLAVLGAGMSFMKRGSQQLWLAAQRKFLITLEVTSKDPAFHWVCQWVNSELSINARRLILKTSRKAAESGKSIIEFNFTPATGIHFMKYNNRWFYVERDRDTSARDLTTGEPWESIKFTTVGTQSHVFQEIMHDARNLATKKDEEHTVIYTSWGHQGWKPFGPPRQRRPLNSVILDKGLSEAVVHDVEEFLKSGEWYRTRGIPYRRGYLLHGPPGSGKSSFVAALAGHIGYDICVLNMNTSGITDDHIALSLSTIPEKSLVLLEDIDAAFHDRKPTREINHITFSGFLNALDGVSAGEERMVFMTTNHYSHLDAALVRPGRVDMIQKLDAASYFQIYHMFLAFYPGEEDRAKVFAEAVSGKDISMAELQGYFMIHKHSVADAFDDAKLFAQHVVEGRKGIRPGMLFAHDVT